MVGIGGGNDGGSIAASRMYMVKLKKMGKKIDPDELAKIKWHTCALTGEVLKPPICADDLGNLFNKQAILEYLLSSKKLPGFEHIRRLKHDITNLKQARSAEDGQAPFICPLSEDEARGTSARFYFIRKCGHVLSEKGLKEILGINPSNDKISDDMEKNCPVCDKTFPKHSLVKLNPSETELKEMKKALEEKKKSTKKTSGASSGEAVDEHVAKDESRSNGHSHSSNSKRHREVASGAGGSAAIRPPSVTEEANSRSKAARSKSKIYDSLFHNDEQAKKNQTDLFIRTSTGVYSSGRV
eukprot:gb/GECG01009665.1/.p1 GENE.gb/GECG01009665.1/~~gb/GECG01009665.1/.p1  ORF type:complete len:298 (+),score=54.12 gb/GECG01009665.1/:1-894(+)